MRALYSLTVMVFIIASCNSNSSKKQENNENSPLVSSQEALDLVQNHNYQLIDLRTPEETAEGSIEGALEINFLSDDFQNEISKLDKSGKYVLYCRSGGRSGKAWNLMNNMGFSEVKDATDGYSSLNEELNKQ